MTAEVRTAIQKRRSALIAAYSYGSVAIDAAADTALTDITTANTVRDVLEVLDALIARSREVTDDSVGGATSGA
jgi:hypothetical protein